jgi:hypothetical protein
MLSTRVPAVHRAIARSEAVSARAMRGHAWALLLWMAACGPAAERARPAVHDAGGAVQPPGDAGDGGPLPMFPSPGIDGGMDGGLLSAVAPRDAGAVDGGSALPLVDPSRWRRVEAGDDPFDDRPPEVECPLIATTYEILGNEPVFDVDTGQCNYLAVVQPTLRDVPAGARLRVRLFHFDLNAPMPAEAHAAIVVQGLFVLDERVPIPASGGLIARELRAERAIPAGTPIHFHLHNHGQNTWALVEVSVTP